MIRLAIGGDHRGFALKQQLMQHRSDISWHDVGCFAETTCDYPPYAAAVAQEVRMGRATGGIVLCGSGVGVSIVANRFPGIYAALVWNEEVARLASADDNANVLALPADFISLQTALTLLSVWLSTPFQAGHYARRLALIDQLVVDETPVD